MTLTTYTARELRRRPGRTALTLLGVVIGVAAMTAISITIEATRDAYRYIFETVSGRASLEVVAEGLGGFDAALADRLAGVAGVQAAVPVIQTPTVLVGGSAPTPALAFGIDLQRDEAVRDYGLHSGRMLAADDEVMLEAGYAGTHGLALQSVVRLITPAGLSEIRVVGLLNASGAAAVNGGAVVFMSLATAQRLFGLEHEINAIHLVLSERAASAQVASAIAHVLTPGLLVQTPADRASLAKHSLFSTEQGLAVMSVASLVACAFVILNSFLMNLAERARHLAILRALGATARQITRMLIREAMLVGAVGTLAGILVGLILSLVLRGTMEQLLGVKLPPFALTLRTLLTALLVGPAVVLLATSFPARAAARRPPLDALRDANLARDRDSQRWMGVVGIVLMALVFLFAGAVLSEWVPIAPLVPLLPVFMATFMVATALLVSAVAPHLVRAVAGLLRPVLNLEARLALRQLSRHSVRTNLAIGVISIAVVISVGFGNTLLNSVRDIHDWCDRIVTFDFMIRASLPDTGIVAAAALPESLATEIGQLDGVDRVGKIAFVPARAAGQSVILLAVSANLDDLSIWLGLAEPEASAVLKRFLDGQIVVGTTLAYRLGLKAGDTINLETRTGPTAARIAHVTTEYTAGGMALYMDWRRAKELFQIAGVHAFDVVARKGSLPEAAATLQALCKHRGLLLESRMDFRRMIEDAIAGVVGCLWLMLALVFVVASLGVINTLTMNVLEQTRELGILRALAMSRARLRRMIRAQAAAIGLISLAPGLLAGLGLAYLMDLCSYPLTGIPIEFRLEYTLVLGCALIAPVVATLAAVVPARRAARLPIIAAIHYE